MVPWNTPQQVAQQLGADNYEEYIARFCEHVHSDYICFDFYPYAANTKLFWENLGIAAEACRKEKRSLWIVLQVNSHEPEVWTSVNRLRFQAYSALAYGAECIFWACYTAGWWHNQVLDENGEKTPQYEKLRCVNAELKGISENYMRYRCVKTHVVEDEPLNAAGFVGVHASDGAQLLVGEMLPRNGQGTPALMICVANDPLDEHPGTIELSFSSKYSWVHEIKGSGPAFLSRDEDGVCRLEMQSCGGVLLIAEEDED